MLWHDRLPQRDRKASRSHWKAKRPSGINYVERQIDHLRAGVAVVLRVECFRQSIDEVDRARERRICTSSDPSSSRQDYNDADREAAFVWLWRNLPCVTVRRRSLPS